MRAVSGSGVRPDDYLGTGLHQESEEAGGLKMKNVS